MPHCAASSPDNGVAAVIVSYHPCLDTLKKQLDRLRTQVQAIIIVDNGSCPDLADWLHAQGLAGVEVLALQDNQGLACAQNQGIAWVRRQMGLHDVLLMDQDSLPAADMVQQLLRVRAQLASQGLRVGAVGPRYVDPRQDNPPPFIQIQRLRLKRHRCQPEHLPVAVDYLIASGSLIAVQTLDIVGDMQEALFIDYIDIEWGMRARLQGFAHFGVCTAHMEHALGDAALSFGRRKIPLHSPLRHYYHFRNAIWLYQQPWVPLNWKCVDGWRLILRYGFYLLLAKQRRERWRKIHLGLWHGWRQRMGRL
ncbi:glycosyltransferase family 2 protein [Thiorhodospira sibirica]|uniref:glycosyltransferase family 2 protein n=1 Tax=Thiorhodospira sibirica TaxID=154347 RepID=UPI00022C22B9|nr:glycosyltransferase family 2 protein [Thiorhodospira sibirica]